YDFHGHGGWASIRRATAIDLPENYAVTVAVRGQAPVNTLQFKLVDSTGQKVWWAVRPDLPLTPARAGVTIYKRQGQVPWGPAGGGTIAHAAAIELSIVPGEGGKGWIEISRLSVRRLPSPRNAAPPMVSIGKGESTIDLHEPREFGGVIVH